MSEYDALLHIAGDDRPMRVEIDLTDERMRVTAGEVEVADWTRDEFRVQAMEDGFHLRAEGEEVVINLEEDARFALELGLRSAHPHLRKKMAALLRDDD